ncbi:hypothetical protein C5167_030445 [Papaver somniferum]|uniref:CASP-like protein 4B4 n=1 Tax=Papaver somniferum TaxID=3469 RepID=UPI000E704D69|nr:CASP-like protein 4B4 [Papaver somniferum]RZC86366.1 hypothetical protein C5167_030445 [Papaver somniferum]
MENYKETKPSAPSANPRTDMESGGQAIPAARPGKSEKVSLILRVAALVFSVVSFIIMACTKNFDGLHQLRYLLAAGILCTVYTTFQVTRQSYYISTGKSLFEQRTTSLVDFFGDQIIAYLLVSSASAAAPFIATMREVEYELLASNETSSMIAASTSMAFLAFLNLAASATISAFKLNK